LKRVLLIGGTGRLGTEIRRRWRDCDVIAPSHEELDLEQSAKVRAAIGGVRPDVVVNAAAFADVDRCEREPERAFAVNALSVRSAAEHTREFGAAFVTISTDYVFDGRNDVAYAETDAPHPLSVYGVSKLAGEYLVEMLGMPAFVVRTCGLYGSSSSNGRPSFIERILTHAPGAPLRVVADVVASPTYAGHLADALRRLIDTTEYGLYHAVDAGAVSWYDFAVEAMRQAGLPPAVEPIAAEEWKAQAIRPRFSALANAKLARAGIAMPTWRDGIAAYLQVR
jgi:dTDP-4-dehydrorhamnose reductase